MPTNNQQGPKHKVLSQEEQDGMMERLYGLSTRNRDKRRKEYEEEVSNIAKRKDKKPPTGELSEKEEKAIQHLYTQSMERKQYTLKKLEQKFVEKPAESKKLQPEEIDSMAERLHAQSKQHHEAMIERLTVKVYGKKGEGQRKLTKGEMDESVGRQYSGAVDKKKENMQKLEDKYLFHPPKKTISPEEVAEMANRLSKKE